MGSPLCSHSQKDKSWPRPGNRAPWKLSKEVDHKGAACGEGLARLRPWTRAWGIDLRRKLGGVEEQVSCEAQPLHTLKLTTWTRGAPAWRLRHNIPHNILNYSEKISPLTAEKTAKQLFIQRLQLNSQDREQVWHHVLSDSALRNMWNFFLPKVPSMILITRMSTKKWHLPRALPRTERQRRLPSASMEIESHTAIAVDLQQPLREFRWTEAPCAPRNLVGQVFRYLDVFRNRFYDLNPCISSYKEKH